MVALPFPVMAGRRVSGGPGVFALLGHASSPVLAFPGPHSHARPGGRYGTIGGRQQRLRAYRRRDTTPGTVRAPGPCLVIAQRAPCYHVFPIRSRWCSRSTAEALPLRRHASPASSDPVGGGSLNSGRSRRPRRARCRGDTRGVVASRGSSCTRIYRIITRSMGLSDPASCEPDHTRSVRTGSAVARHSYPPTPAPARRSRRKPPDRSRDPTGRWGDLPARFAPQGYHGQYGY
jgi:hypothetical protein